MTRTDPDPTFADAVVRQIAEEIRQTRRNPSTGVAATPRRDRQPMVTVVASVVVLALIAVVTIALTRTFGPDAADRNAASLGTSSTPASVDCGRETGFAPFHCNTYTSQIAADHETKQAWATNAPVRVAFRYRDGRPSLLVRTSCASMRIPVTVSATRLVADLRRSTGLDSGCDAADQRWVLALLDRPITFSQTGAVILFEQRTFRFMLKALGSVGPRTGPAAPWNGSLVRTPTTWTATTAGELRPCTLGQLSTWAQHQGGQAMSTYYQGVFLRNNGASCSLHDAGVTIVVGHDRAHATLVPSRDVLYEVLPAGASMSLALSHGTLCERNPGGQNPGPTPTAQQLHLRIGSAERALDAAMPWGGTCTGLGIEPRGLADDLDFAGDPSDRLPSLAVSLSTTPNLETLRAGILSYRIVLTNTGPTSYAPATCPSFVQVVVGSHSATAQGGTLNCHAVPAIPPGGSRAYEMRLRIGGQDDPQLGWFLVGGRGVSAQG